jgi:hypothetical protein
MRKQVTIESYCEGEFQAAKCFNDSFESVQVKNNYQESNNNFYKKNRNCFSTNQSFMKSNNDLNNSIKKIKIYEKPNEWYEGEVDNKYKRHGFGVYNYANGDIYEGEFETGQRSGIGEYKYCDGTWFRGQWKNDKKNGIGVRMDKNGIRSYGKWRNNILITKITKQESMTFIQNAEVSQYINSSDDDSEDCMDYESEIGTIDLNLSSFPETPIKHISDKKVKAMHRNSKSIDDPNLLNNKLLSNFKNNSELKRTYTTMHSKNASLTSTTSFFRNPNQTIDFNASICEENNNFNLKCTNCEKDMFSGCRCSEVISVQMNAKLNS